MNNPYRRSGPRPQTLEERTIEKYHPNLRESVKKNIDKSNFKIQFKERTWVLKEETVCGFTGHTAVKATQIDPEPFGVLSVTRDKKTQCSQIWVWSDGAADGANYWLVNVPNGLFKEIHDEDA